MNASFIILYGCFGTSVLGTSLQSYIKNGTIQRPKGKMLLRKGRIYLVHRFMYGGILCEKISAFKVAGKSPEARRYIVLLSGFSRDLPRLHVTFPVSIVRYRKPRRLLPPPVCRQLQGCRLYCHLRDLNQ